MSSAWGRGGEATALYDSYVCGLTKPKWWTNHAVLTKGWHNPSLLDNVHVHVQTVYRLNWLLKSTSTDGTQKWHAENNTVLNRIAERQPQVSLAL